MKTTLYYVIDDSGAFLWPSTINLFYSNFTVHIDVKYCGHIDVLISKPISFFPRIIGCNIIKFLKFYTYVFHFLWNRIGPKAVPAFLSIWYASFTILGAFVPKLFDMRQYLYFILEIILSWCRKVSWVHQLKAGS